MSTDDRPATTDQTTRTYAATTDAARTAIAGTITAARIDSRSPQETADAVLGVLAAEGYTLTRSDLFDPARIRSAIARYETTGWPTPRPVAHVAYEDAPARASHGHQEANTAPHGTADRHGAAEGTQTLSEPRYIVETNHFGQWLHGLEFDDLTEARDYAEYCHATYGGTRIVRVTREVIT